MILYERGSVPLDEDGKTLEQLYITRFSRIKYEFKYVVIKMPDEKELLVFPNHQDLDIKSMIIQDNFKHFSIIETSSGALVKEFD